jgi:hypothetical protein
VGVLGLIGILMFCFGAHVLWQSRKEVFDWLQEFFRILRREFSRRSDLSPADANPPSPEDSPDGLPASARGRRHSGALRLVGGVGLMVLGQALFLLDLVF